MRWRDSTALYIEAPLFNIRHSMVLLERGLKIQRKEGRIASDWVNELNFVTKFAKVIQMTIGNP